MRRTEYSWIYSRDGTNDNVSRLKALARTFLREPKHFGLIDCDRDLFGDGNVTLVSTSGHSSLGVTTWEDKIAKFISHQWLAPLGALGGRSLFCDFKGLAERT
jgi:hypothetical protein